jgi:hypothetical protein
MTTPPDAAVRAAIDTAFGILDILRAKPPHANETTYAMLMKLTADHGGGALGAVWMIWARSIAIGIDNKGTPTTALFPESDRNPDLRYARNAVALARQKDAEGISELVDAVFRDQERQRSGASIPATSAFLAMGAVLHGEPGTPTEWSPPQPRHQ